MGTILGPVGAAMFATGGCSGAVATPSPTILRSPLLTSAPTASPTSTSGATPTPTRAPTPAPTPDTTGVATRIVIASLRINLPVVEFPTPPAPFYCNVAMWWSDNGNFVLPGRRGSTFILAQPRAGMFLPLLQASQVSDGKSLIGSKVEVYTSADWQFTFSIAEVRRHVKNGRDTLDLPLGATSPELWVETGEGGIASPVLLVGATLVSASSASHAAAQPSPKIVACP